MDGLRYADQNMYPLQSRTFRELAGRSPTTAFDHP